MAEGSEFHRACREREKTCGEGKGTWRGTWRHFATGEESCGWCPEYVPPKAIAGRLAFVAALAGAGVGAAVAAGLWGTMGVWTAVCVSMLVSTALVRLRQSGSLVTGWGSDLGFTVVLFWLLSAAMFGEVTDVSVSNWSVEASDVFWAQFAIVGSVFGLIWLFGQALNYWLWLKVKDQPLLPGAEIEVGPGEPRNG